MRILFFVVFVVVIPLLFLAGFAFSETAGETTGKQKALSFSAEVCDMVNMKYLLYLPEGYSDSQEKWPLLLFLHGAGERGDDLTLVEKHGPPRLIAENKRSFPFIIVSPQCPEDGWWTSMEQLNALGALLDSVVKAYRVDEERIYLTGLSMGGYGTWRLAAEHPELFAAIAPICGGGERFLPRKLKNVPVWAFHGARDDVVPLNESQDMVNALQKSGGNAILTVYPEAGHDSWTETYDNPALYEWFLQHKRIHAE